MFQSLRLIDYSLLVFKVDWGKYAKDYDVSISELLQMANHPFAMVGSVVEKGVK